MDWRNSAYVDYYKAVLVNGFANGGKMAKSGSGHNAMFFDNGVFDGQGGAWNNSGGVNRASWKTTMVNALDTIRDYYDTQGDTIIMNAYSDITDHNLYTADPAYYRSVVDKAHYIVYERTNYKLDNGNPPLTTSEVLNYVDTAFDYNTNTSTTVLWSTEYGADFWYNFTSGLFACTATKCGFWQQPAMTSTQITKTTTLDLGVPTAAYAQSGCYYRTFTKGIAVANLTGSNCNYTLPAGNYTDWIAGGTVSGQRTLSANTGKIYIAE